MECVSTAKGRLTSVDSWLDSNGVEPPFVAGLTRRGRAGHRCRRGGIRPRRPADAYDFLVSDADHFNSHRWLDQHLRIVQSDGFLFFHDTNARGCFRGWRPSKPRSARGGLACFHFKESSRPDERCQRGWLFVINKK